MDATQCVESKVDENGPWPIIKNALGMYLSSKEVQKKVEKEKTTSKKVCSYKNFETQAGRDSVPFAPLEQQSQPAKGRSSRPDRREYAGRNEEEKTRYARPSRLMALARSPCVEGSDATEKTCS
jgi:hypothetical protein